MAYAVKRATQERLSHSGRHGLVPMSGQTANVIPPQKTYAALRGQHETSRNGLLESLPYAEQARLRPHLEPFGVEQGDVLTYQGQWVNHVYFPASALVALLVSTEGGGAVETGLVGAEGMVNLPVFWGDDRVHYTSVAIQAGLVLRMDAGVFRQEAKGVYELQQSLLRYTSFSFTCAAQRVACNRLHSVGERTAALLLNARDHLGRDRLHATHELIAGLVGARRAGVTIALNEFRKGGSLRLGRGQIEIVEPRELESLTCECYRVIRTELDKFRGVRTEGAPAQSARAERAV
jgi:CRP-like cAMP-binding protein